MKHAMISSGVPVFEQAQQELLIMGEPGTGKSTMLIELAHHLVEQAEQDTIQPSQSTSEL